MPDFLGIGAMKSGTTWLYENLRCHPGIFLPRQKELYYFSLHYHEGSLRHYARRFDEGAGQVKGEITPGYATLPLDRIRFIKQVMPDVKLIFLVRDPVQRSWSEGYMNLVVKPKSRLADVSDETFIRYFSSEECTKRSDYVKTLERWLGVFSPEALFIGTLDEVQEEPQKLLARLFRHLGVSAEVEWQSFPYQKMVVPLYESNRMVFRGEVSENQQSSDELMPGNIRTFLREMYGAQIEELGRKFGLAVGRWQTNS